MNRRGLCRPCSEFAVRYPSQVARLVLLCPSGLAEEESLPIIEGVRRSDMEAVVRSVVSNPGIGQRPTKFPRSDNVSYGN